MSSYVGILVDAHVFLCRLNYISLKQRIIDDYYTSPPKVSHADLATSPHQPYLLFTPAVQAMDGPQWTPAASNSSANDTAAAPRQSAVPAMDGRWTPVVSVLNYVTHDNWFFDSPYPNDTCEDQLHDTFDVAEPDELYVQLAELAGIPIMTKDFRTLMDGKWLNDEIMKFYVAMLNQREARLICTTPSRKCSNLFRTFFVAKLLEQGHYQYSLVRKWTKSIDLLKYDKLFFPITVGETTGHLL